MKTTIKAAGDTGRGNESLVLVIRDVKSIPAGIFSAEELKYVRNQLDEKKKAVVVNQ